MRQQSNAEENTRPARPSARPASVTDGPSGLPGLQRSVGNAAVVQMLRRAGHRGATAAPHDRHGPGCGHEQQTEGPAVQRSSVHGVLGGPGRAMNDSVRTEMESRLDADFTDVRIHDGADARASAAEIGARAYTSGSHVVLGKGGGDKHTLAHELTHVIQQRQGPVAGTDNGSGLRVSDPSDHFERAAEANARRAMSRPHPQPTHADTHAHAHGDQHATEAAPAAAVQRAPESRPTVHAGTNDEWEAHSTPGRTDGIVLSGHGSWDQANGEFRVPPGVKVHTYCMHGNTVLDANGARVETGDKDLLPQNIRDGRNTMLDYTIHAPSGLDIHGSPVAITATGGGYDVQLDPTQPATVTVPTLNDPQLAGRSLTFTHDIRLSTLLRPGMGNVHFAACLHLEIPGMAGRTRNQA
ncbi:MULTISPECIES: DUF4157 domain-containing protein [unclassified Streptomyces]|uniref:eCIS core domain-containing protein n=1 Tax=unclassified Streptomyces TaxID=2593676 RepID=UPI0037A782BF